MLSRKIQYLLISISLVLQVSCVKEIDKYQDDGNSANTITDINQIQVPANFNYSNERKVNLTLHLKTNTDDPMPGIKISVLSGLPGNNGVILYTGVTNTTGTLTTTFTTPKTLKEVYIQTGYVGLPDYAVADISTGTITVTLGGSNPQRIRVIPASFSDNASMNYQNRNSSFPSLKYLGGWNTQGVPDYLAGNRDVIHADLLRRINAGLPEYKSVPALHPQLINPSAPTAIEVTQTSGFWMTFVHEGSSKRNAVGFYKYHKNNPPASIYDIPEITITFPNLSYRNSGGGLVPGDQVYLRTVGPDSMIGFVLLSDGYNVANASLTTGNCQYFSNSDLNPETQSIKKYHSVLIWDDTENKMIVGFEDINRNAASDEDFNDAVFYITSDIPSAIATASANKSAAPVDTDGDGIDDNADEYPTDPELAFNNYYPSIETFGYLAFEDLWPYKGDYDLNDLLVGYRFNLVTNANNDIKEVQSKIFVKAAGGSYQHGFGIEFPVPGYFIETVNGPQYTENYISLNANGTEANQNNAVVVVFDNSNSVAPCQNGYYVNTEPGSPVINSDTIRLAVRFVSGIPPNTLGSAPFNPFIISNKRRGYEIHLPDKTPTTLADPSLFNTGQDRSNIALGRYYKSDNNLPWCINIPSDFPIITEKTSIINAYLHFVEWAQSAGTLYPDWYEDKPGYRDNNKLLHR